MSTPYHSGAFINVTHETPAPGGGSVMVVWQPEPLVRYPFPVAWVRIRANQTNTGIFCIGDESINALSNPVKGDYLFATERWIDEDCDLSMIFLHSSVAGESVSFTYARS